MLALEKARKMIIPSLDGMATDPACRIVFRLNQRTHTVKIHDLYDSGSYHVIERLLDAGAQEVWIDFKIDDSRTTTKLRAKALVNAGASILTVHATAGTASMKAMVESGAQVYAVVLRSWLSDEEVFDHYHRWTEEVVEFFAAEAKKAGVHGFVCPGRFIHLLTQNPEYVGMEFVVADARLPNDLTAADHHSPVTLQTAAKAGATRLIVGRPLTLAVDPVVVWDLYRQNLECAFEET